VKPSQTLALLSQSTSFKGLFLICSSAIHDMIIDTKPAMSNPNGLLSQKEFNNLDQGHTLNGLL